MSEPHAALPAMTKLVGQAIVVADLDSAVSDYERFGFALSDRSARPEWQIDTATFGFRDGCWLELAAPMGKEHPVGRAVSRFLADRGGGLYLSTLEVPDVDLAYRQLCGAGVNVLAPPVAAPAARGIDCRLIWLAPNATAGAFVQLVAYPAERHVEHITAPAMRGLFNQAIAVGDLERAITSFEQIGLVLADRSSRADWGLDTATFHCAEHSSIELVAATDTSRPAAGAIAAFLGDREGGHYMTVFEVDDVDELHDRLVRAGVPVLGPPSDTPPESPWPPARQLWIHPRASHGAFIEFLSLAG